MKFGKIALAFLIFNLAISFAGKAQNFSFEPKNEIDTIITTVFNEPLVEMNAFLKNQSAGTITCRWVLIRNDFKTQNVDHSVCDPFQCHITLPDSSTFDVASGEKGNFKLDFTLTKPITALLRFKVFEVNNPSYVDTLTFKVDASTAGVNDVINSKKVSIYPCPVSQTLTYSINGGNKVENVLVTDLTGKTVATTKDNAQIDVANLKSGSYFLKIFTNDGVAVKPFIKVN